MIRLRRRLGCYPAGTAVALDPRAERLLSLMGMATAVEEGPDLEAMTKAQLAGLAEERGLEVGPKATKAQIAEVIRRAS